jgi:hypothetical protein
MYFLKSWRRSSATLTKMCHKILSTHIRKPDNNCSFYSYVNEEEGMPESYRHGETKKSREAFNGVHHS